MRIALSFALAFALVAPLAACAKASPEARAHTTSTATEPAPMLTDIAPPSRAAADEPRAAQEPNQPPGSRPSAQPDNNGDRDRVGPERTGLPSSRVDGGGAPKPLPPGVTMDAGPL